MPRSRNRATPTQSHAEVTFDWFKSGDSSPEGVADWDIKREALSDAILGLLGEGLAVMFGVTRDGGAVSVTLFEGERKQRKYVSDSIEFDDVIDGLNDVLRKRRNTPLELPSREVGD